MRCCMALGAGGHKARAACLRVRLPSAYPAVRVLFGIGPHGRLHQALLGFDDLGQDGSLAGRDLTLSHASHDRGKGGGGLLGIPDFWQR